ncbi:MAG: GEVED domain-containing protein [Ferruginibacter sp.]
MKLIILLKGLAETAYTLISSTVSPVKNRIAYTVLLLFSIVSLQQVQAQSDGCAAAPLLAVNTGCTPTSYNVQNSWNNETGTPLSCSGTSHRDGWYRFTTGSAALPVIITGTSNRQMGLAVYSGSCGSLTQVACTVPGAANASLTTPTLLANTTYYLRIMRTSNSANNDMTGTICIADYCISSGNTSYQTGVRRVIFNTLDNATGATKTAGYTDFTNLSTTVQTGSSYNLTVNLNTDGPYTIYARAWIDWNQNGSFESTEQYNLGTAFWVSNGASSLSPLSITVPSGAALGSTVMRVSAQYNAYAGACDVGYDGEVEDYTVVVQSANPTITGFSPTSGCVGSTVNITGTNFTGVTGVTFNNIAATSFTINSATSITATVPAGGTGLIRVTNGAATAVSAGSVTVLTTPAAVTVSGGGTYCGSTSVTASGGSGGTIYFQGTVSGGTSTGLGGATQTITGSGTYYFRSYNGSCWGPEGSVTVTIVTTTPSSVSVSAAGSTPYCGSVTINATGGTGGTIYYQGITSGGTSTATPSASQTVTTSGTYYFRSYNGCSWGPEGSVTVTVNAIPGAVSISGGGLSCGSANLVASGGSGGTLYFQGTTSGGTSTALGGANQTVTVAGTYYFRSLSPQGCWGPEASVSVSFIATASITSHPANATACVGQPASFSVTVNPTTVNYQWRKGTNNIAGANSATYTIASVTLADAAVDYNCLITDACGSVVSNDASLTVNAATAAPTAAPTALTFIAGTSSIVGTFTAAADAQSYLVVRTTGAAPTNPVNGTSYTAGATALGGYIEYSGPNTTFYSTGLAQGTTYTYWIFSYNANACGTTPLYYTPSLSGAATTGTSVSCGTIGNLYWAGLGSSLGATSSTNLNVAANWSTSSSSYNASPIVPGNCTNVFIDVRSEEIVLVRTDPNLQLSGNLQVRNLTFNARAGYGWFFLTYSFGSTASVNTNGYTLTVNGIANIDMSSNDGNNISIGESSGSAGVVDFKADVNLGTTSYASGRASLVGSATSKMIFNGNLTLGPTAYVTAASAPENVDFEGVVNLITWNNTLNAVNFRNVRVGASSTSSTTVLHAGSVVPNAITGNLTINGSSTLNLATGQWNRSEAGGTFAINNTGTLKLGLNASNASYGVNVAGSNFPGGFSALTFTSGSTVEYNGLNSITQTVYSAPVYGNLILTNGSGSSTANKILSANMAGIAGNLTINNAALFDMATYTANRTSNGGSLNILGTGRLNLSGTTGGVGANNNFPNNFAAMNIASTSTVGYLGAAQGIYAGVQYGNLELGGTSTKTAPSGTLSVKGNLTKISTTSFVHNSGLVSFTGTGTQTYSSTSPVMEFFNLTNANTTGILLVSSGMGIANNLVLGSTAKLNLGAGDISLRSTATRTANVNQVPSGAQINYTGTGRFVVERYLPTFKAWRFLATPVSSTGSPSVTDSWREAGSTASTGYGTQITGPSGNTGMDEVTVSNSMKWYNSTTNTYVPVTNTNDAISRKEGYMVFVRGDRSVNSTTSSGNVTNLRIRGQIQTGDQSYSVAGGKFISVGNPYPAPISVSTMLSTYTGLAGAYYAWDPSIAGTYNAGGYQTFSSLDNYKANVTGGNFSSGSSMYTAGQNYPDIQSGQAIYLYNAGTGTVNFQVTESMKQLVNTAAMSRENTMEDRQFIRTKLFTSGNVIADGNLVAFDDELSSDIDGDDALKFSNSGENFGMLRNGKKLAAEARARPAVTDTIFYNMTNLKVQDYKIQVVAENFAGSPLSAFLVDKFLNTETPVSLLDSNIITVTMTNDAASRAAGRFMLVFKQAQVLPVTFVSISAQRQQDRSVKVNWEVANEVNIEKYEVERSANGLSFSPILANDATGSRNYARTDLSPLSSDNFYRIKAIGLAGDITYSAIAKVGADKEPGSITIMPNPVRNKQMNIRFVKQPQGEYAVVLTNTIGQAVYQGMISTNTASMVKTISLPSILVGGNYHVTVRNKVGEVVYAELVVIE